MFYWGCEEEIVPMEVAGAMRMVRDLQKGRTVAVDYDDIQRVHDSANGVNWQFTTEDARIQHKDQFRQKTVNG